MGERGKEEREGELTVYTSAHRSKFPEARVTNSHESLTTGSGNWSQALYKRSAPLTSEPSFLSYNFAYNDWHRDTDAPILLTMG